MTWFAKTLRALAPNCREAIRLQSEALDRPLTWRQRFGLWLHLGLCLWCRRYGQQIKFLRAADQRCDQDEAVDQTLPAAARERIKHALKDGK